MKFIKSLTIAFALIALLIMVGCSDNGSKSAIVRGVVKDSATSNALSGVTVSAGTAIATTDVNGKFSLSVAPGSNIKIKAVKTGFIEVFDICGVNEGGSAEVDFSLNAIGYEKNLTAMKTTQTSATDARGTAITLPAGSIVDSSNNTVDAAKIEVTTSMPNDNNFIDNFPGLFIGTQTGQPDKPIESFGFISVDITDATGNIKYNLGKDNLGNPKTATIDIPVGIGAADPGTADIDLWSLDESTGKWKWEAKANRIPGPPVVYRATVTHFSAYNLDRPIASPISLTVTVKNGTALVAGASVVAKKTSAPAWEGRGVTGANGTFKFDTVPAGTNLVKATFGNLGGTVYALDIVGTDGTATITLQQTISKEVSFYYMNGLVKTPAVGANIGLWAQGGGDVWGVTDANGKYTFDLVTGLPSYTLNGNLTVGPTTYTYNHAFNSIASIPSEVELTKP
ncbi:MAG: hypothetical protein WCO98_07925 [bacterium]